jgi:hypothetical protein
MVASFIFSSLSYSGQLLTDLVEHTRESSGSAPSIRRRPQWTPPNFAWYSFFDSGLQLSDGPDSKPDPSSSTATLGTSDAHASRRRSARQPQELDAHDTRDPRAIQVAMKLQRERDRI